jgi:hypothetical protein
MSFDPIPFDAIQGLSQWLKVMLAALVLVVVVPLIVSPFIFGWRGPWAVLRQFYEGIRDISELSLRRIWAISSLTAREAVRRKALLVFVVFAILFMFGSWFLPSTGEKADLAIQRHVVFVFTAISWLVLPVVLLLSCWGIPEDIRARSLHTVVTKPVRRVEVVIGRMLGFSLVATFIVGLMGCVGYVWIDRQIPQSAHGQMVCKVPYYGHLSFIDRQGEPATQGINVGDVWTFRSYIEGSTKATAIWDFNNISGAMLTPVVSKGGSKSDYLRLQTSFESFRSHKGIMSSGLLCELTLVNPDKNLRVPLPPFEVAEYRGDGNQTWVPRKVEYYDSESKQKRTVDLIDDLVGQGGRLKIEARCLNSEQYLGMARPDLFIRIADRDFAVGYFKALGGVWMEAILVVMIGVAVSCFVKGPVATLLTFSILVVGQGFRDLIEKIVRGEQLGGGPMESIYRMVTHMNQTVDLELSQSVTTVIKKVDEGVGNGIWLIQQTFPNFSYYGMSAYVAKGFDVDFRAAILPAIAVTLAYVVPCVLVGYYSLKLRELESK